MSDKTAVELFEELKRQVEGERDPKVTKQLFEQIIEALDTTPSRFAKEAGMSWTTVNRWLTKGSCPRVSNLGCIEKVVREEVSLAPIEGLLAFTGDGMLAHMQKVSARVWAFMGPGMSAVKLLGELLPSVAMERFYVFPVDAAEPFRSFRRKVERGGLRESLLGKVIGMAVEPNDYPLFISGTTLYLLEFQRGNEMAVEGYMALPVMTSSDAETAGLFYLRIEDELVREWYEYCELLLVWYRANEKPEVAIQEFEVKYS